MHKCSSSFALSEALNLSSMAESTDSVLEAYPARSPLPASNACRFIFEESEVGNKRKAEDDEKSEGRKALKLLKEGINSYAAPGEALLQSANADYFISDSGLCVDELVSSQSLQECEDASHLRANFDPDSEHIAHLSSHCSSECESESRFANGSPLSYSDGMADLKQSVDLAQNSESASDHTNFNLVNCRFEDGNNEMEADLANGSVSRIPMDLKEKSHIVVEDDLESLEEGEIEERQDEYTLSSVEDKDLEKRSDIGEADEPVYEDHGTSLEVWQCSPQAVGFAGEVLHTSGTVSKSTEKNKKRRKKKRGGKKGGKGKTTTGQGNFTPAGGTLKKVATAFKKNADSNKQRRLYESSETGRKDLPTKGIKMDIRKKEALLKFARSTKEKPANSNNEPIHSRVAKDDEPEEGEGFPEKEINLERDRTKNISMTAQRRAKRKAAKLRKRAENPRISKLPKSKPIKVVEAPICKFFMKGRCKQGESCTFSHNVVPLTKSEICKFYMNHCCLKGEDCLYSHDLSVFPCKYYNTKGYCTDGVFCRFSHKPITEEEYEKLMKRVEPEKKEPHEPVTVQNKQATGLNGVSGPLTSPLNKETEDWPSYDPFDNLEQSGMNYELDIPDTDFGGKANQYNLCHSFPDFPSLEKSQDSATMSEQKIEEHTKRSPLRPQMLEIMNADEENIAAGTRVTLNSASKFAPLCSWIEQPCCEQGNCTGTSDRLLVAARNAARVFAAAEAEQEASTLTQGLTGAANEVSKVGTGWKGSSLTLGQFLQASVCENTTYLNQLGKTCSFNQGNVDAAMHMRKAHCAGETEGLVENNDTLVARKRSNVEFLLKKALMG
ncbi:hypothetical protein O6H91_20G026300 [Diphasiastrum complanatum]|uniref:Uncharacterized protein n=1 Tax=Diphasiastrum complanatum TaxID=34168 RepID=A0ACC2ANS8_DIPCM|nr:hypothetical protein O6H91_20G026300 [Diphasiastrum complanatum]